MELPHIPKRILDINDYIMLAAGTFLLVASFVYSINDMAAHMMGFLCCVFGFTGIRDQFEAREAARKTA